MATAERPHLHPDVLFFWGGLLLICAAGALEPVLPEDSKEAVTLASVLGFAASVLGGGNIVLQRFRGY
jgi:hypothetical protein